MFLFLTFCSSQFSSLYFILCFFSFVCLSFHHSVSLYFHQCLLSHFSLFSAFHPAHSISSVCLSICIYIHYIPISHSLYFYARLVLVALFICLSFPSFSAFHPPFPSSTAAYPSHSWPHPYVNNKVSSSSTTSMRKSSGRSSMSDW